MKTIVLGTTGSAIRWYSFADLKNPKEFVVHDVLDTNVVNCFGDRATANAIAQAAGLNGRYRLVYL